MFQKAKGKRDDSGVMPGQYGPISIVSSSYLLTKTFSPPVKEMCI